MRRSLLPLLAPLLAACLVEFPPLPEDGSPAEAAAEAGRDLAGVDRGPRSEGPGRDGPLGPDGPAADTGSTSCLASWSSWTCNKTPATCVATCAAYKLVCNNMQCTCTDGTTNKVCGPATTTQCSECQGAFGDGCCDGL